MVKYNHCQKSNFCWLLLSEETLNIYCTQILFYNIFMPTVWFPVPNTHFHQIPYLFKVLNFQNQIQTIFIFLVPAWPLWNLGTNCEYQDILIPKTNKMIQRLTQSDLWTHNSWYGGLHYCKTNIFQLNTNKLVSMSIISSSNVQYCHNQPDRQRPIITLWNWAYPLWLRGMFSLWFHCTGNMYKLYPLSLYFCITL